MGCAVALLAAACSAACVPRGLAQERVPDGTLVSRVEIAGLENIGEGFVRRLIKTRANQPYIHQQVQEDLRELIRSRKFLNAFADARLEDDRAVVVFTVQERPVIAAVELRGNKRFPRDKLFEVTPAAGGPLDRYEINRGREEIERKYKEAGYYYVRVTLDEPALEREGRVVYTITEGPRVKIRRIVLEGAHAFPEPQLRLKIRSKTYLWIFRTGAFDEEQAERDALELERFYRDEGFLDARAGYRLDFRGVERSDLNLVFVVEEGPRYRVDSIDISGNTVFDEQRVRDVMQLAPGKFMRAEAVRADVKRIEDIYGEIGYIDARVTTRSGYLPEAGAAVLHVEIVENSRSRFGRITIRGNPHTKDEVARRELRFFPGDYYNIIKTREAEQRLAETGLFTRNSTITPLPGEGDLREALVQVEEAQTVLFLVGVGLSTDSGVLGSLTIENRNFDLWDWPRSPGEFFRGQAFRGDGQRLRFQFEPGTELTRFRIDFTEPYLFDRPVQLGTSFYLFERGREGYDEQRVGTVISLGRRFESGWLENWAVEGAVRVEGVGIDDVDPLSPSDVRNVRGDHLLTALKASVVRDTTDSRIVPSRGYRLRFSWEQIGALGGDHAFGRPSAGFEWYRTLRTDVLDRHSVLGLRADVAYIVGDAPVFERYYGGGFGSLRGFAFRGISPRKGVYDTPVGGDFIFLTGAEYSFPVYGKTLRGVTFLDMGTVEDDFALHSWRAAAGFGLRVTIDYFGPVPMIFDFGFPLAKTDEDDAQIFNFSIGASW